MSIKISNVLLLDNVDPSAKTILENNGIKATLSKEKFTPDGLVKELQVYDALVVRSATKVSSEIIENCPNLKIIGRAGVGVDNIDVKSATKHGIIVMNTPSGNTISAAEHTCTLICCLSRNVAAADASMKAGKWDRKAFMGHELFGKTLGIIGLGRIGREAAIRMQSFGMATIGFDPLVSKEEAAKYDIEWITVDEMWPRADYITVHTPLIPQTKGLLNDTSFAKCKKGVRVVNCARGGIIDEDALLRALESGQCGGAGLDVYVKEPATNFELVNHPKVVACPHLGASTVEGQARCGKEIAEQFVDVACGKNYFGVINAPALNQSTGVENWISALQGVGKIMRKFFKCNPTQLNIDTNDLLSHAGKCLKSAFCSGFLHSSASGVNLVNASVMMSEIGINVEFSNKNEKIAGFASCTVHAHNEIVSKRLATSLVEGKAALVAIDNHIFHVPVVLCGNLIIYKSPPESIVNVIDALSKLGASVTSLSTTSVSDNSQWVAIMTSQYVDIENQQISFVENLVSVTL